MPSMTCSSAITVSTMDCGAVRVWSNPSVSNTWPEVSRLTAEGTHPAGSGTEACDHDFPTPRHPAFVDISAPALRRLRKSRRRKPRAGPRQPRYRSRMPRSMLSAPWTSSHVVDCDGVLTELAGVAESGAVVLPRLSWTAFDDFVGHYRRYEPEQLVTRRFARTVLLSSKARSTACNRHSCVFGDVVPHPSARASDVVLRPNAAAMRALPATHSNWFLAWSVPHRWMRCC